LRRLIVLRPKARNDLRDIWQYTQSHWGEDQADEYIGQIMRALDGVAETPLLGSDRAEIRPGLRKVTVQSHAIYYFHDDATLRVSRVLHVRRDAAGAL
jgi:toxin ParE1/3/4